MAIGALIVIPCINTVPSVFVTPTQAGITWLSWTNQHGVWERAFVTMGSIEPQMPLCSAAALPMDGSQIPRARKG